MTFGDKYTYILCTKHLQYNIDNDQIQKIDKKYIY